MKPYAQNAEDEFIKAFFGNSHGVLLDIGANDGQTFSNSRLLLENGWSGHLVEPASVFYDLKRLYLENKNVHCYNLAIGETMGMSSFFESGAHVKGGTDRALVSTLEAGEMARWLRDGVTFEEKQVSVVPFNFFWEMTGFSKFDFISVDAEGFDWAILRQIDLLEVGCRCLCIEWNGDENLKADIVKYCGYCGLTLRKINHENLILTL